MSIKQIILVAKREQMTALLNSGKMTTETLVAAFDLEAVVEAEERVIPFINLFTYLDQPTVRENEQKAWRLCDKVFQALKGVFLYEGCDLVDRIRMDLAYPVIYALNSSSVIERCLHEHLQARVGVFPQMRLSFVLDPPAPPPDLFNAVAWWQTERLGKIPYPVEAPLPLSPIPAPCLLQQTATRRVARSEAEPKMPDSPCQSISVADDLSFAEQACLYNYIKQKGFHGWGVVTSKPVEGLARINPRLLWRIPVALSALGEEIDAFKERYLPELRRVFGSEYDAVLQNPHVEFFWDFFCDLLRMGANRYAIGRLLAEGLRPNTVIIGHDYFGVDRCLTQAFVVRGIIPVSIYHPGITALASEAYRHTGAHGHLGVWTESQASGLRSFRDPGYRIKAIGSLRTDLDGINKLGPSVSARSEYPRVVFFTGLMLDILYFSGSSVRHHQDWLQLTELCARHSEWDFVIKPHPRYDYSALYSSAAFRRLSNLVLVRGNPREVLAGAHAAVLVNVVSNVALDAIAANVPLVFLKTAIHADIPPHDIEKGGAIAANSMEALETALIRLITDDEFRAKCLTDAHLYLKRVLPWTGDEAARRMLEFVDELTAEYAADGKAPPPNPAAYWLLELLNALAAAQSGDWTVEQLEDVLRGLRVRAQTISLTTLEYLDLSVLGRAILQMVVWQPWCQPVFLPRMLRLIYRVLPKRLRPSWSVLRAHLVQAYVEQGRRTSSWRCAIMPYILAPGRLRKRVSRENGTTDGFSETAPQPKRRLNHGCTRINTD